MQRFRGFIAVDIPVTKQLLSFEKALAATSAKLKIVAPENIHVTLKFLGDTPLTQIDHIESAMKEAVKTATPHKVILRGTGVFPNENYIKVIWIGLQHAEAISGIATKLNRDLTCLGFKKEKRAFSAHLTIARMKSAQGKEEIISLIRDYDDVTFAEIPIQNIMLKKSTLTPQGPIYETVKTVPINE